VSRLRSRNIWRMLRVIGCLGLLALSACVQKAPPELVQELEALDRQLIHEQGAEFAPEEYAQFVKDWVAVKGRLGTDDDVIHWPWEPDTLTADLRRVHQKGTLARSAASQRREAERLEAEARLEALERRLQRFMATVDEMGSRLVLGQRPMETDLLAKQARTFYHQGLYARSLESVEAASNLIDDQAATLTTQLGRYASEASVAMWRRMAQRTVEWSRRHGTAAIIVSKADRRLTLYHGGKAVGSYPVRLGFNGMMEKRFQGDGATPEGEYRVIRKRDRGETEFYRALLLDYPNAKDRRRFRLARERGMIPTEAVIGGQIEIHGGDETLLSQTLGCVMLDNRQIDVVFRQTETGTPVIIVGALKVANAVSLALTSLEQESESAGIEDEEAVSSRKLVSATEES
jgi:hypothetical protein